MSTDMDDILKGEDSEAAKPETEEQTEASKDDADKGSEGEGEAKPEEEPAKGEEAATPAAENKATVPLNALLDEREKRQDLERRLAEAKPEKAPDFSEDPEAAFKHLEKTVDDKANTRFVNLTVQMAKDAHKDFDEVMETYKELTQATPGLHQQALQASNPGEFAYQAALRHRQLSEIGDIEEFRKKAIEEGKRLALEEVEKANSEKPEKERSSLPESLASERSVGDRKGPAWSGPTPMDEILAPKR